MFFVPVLRFAKYHGLGNDFIVVDARDAKQWVRPSEARRLCDRRRGIGADGVLTLLPPRDKRADLRMHIINADGSIPEMCGNGLRCVAAHALRGSEKTRIVVDTDAGLRDAARLDDGRLSVTLGKARILEARIDATVGGEAREGMGISMGNPHLVLLPLDRPTDLRADALRLGPTLERHPKFPERTNVGFIAVRSPRGLDVVVFERGVGLTDACGTGAGAATVAAKRWGLVDREKPIAVSLPGGMLEVSVDADEVAITGDAVHVFDGEIEVSESGLS
jgi:diaminopimelate epimerase